jgi:superfamily II DNA/RNA helicase
MLTRFVPRSAYVVRRILTQTRNTTAPSLISTETFASLDFVSEPSQRAISEKMKFEFMTNCQSMCIPSIHAGLDCLAKSKTGTG